MPDTKPKMIGADNDSIVRYYDQLKKDPQFKKIYDSVMPVLTQKESGGRYQEVVDGKTIRVRTGGGKGEFANQSASGKYQFQKRHFDGMKRIAKKNNITVPDNMTFEQMMDDPTYNVVQDMYSEAFTAYNYKQAQEILKSDPKNNPLNLNIAEMTALMHFQGSGDGPKAIMSGKLPGKTGINADVSTYMKDFTQKLKASGKYTSPQTDLNQIKATDAQLDKSPESNAKRLKIQKDYEASYSKIINSNQDELSKNAAISVLNKQAYESGNLEMINRRADFLVNEEKRENRYLELSGKLSKDEKLSRQEELEYETLKKNMKEKPIAAFTKDMLSEKKIGDVKLMKDYFTPQQKELQKASRIKRVDLSQYDKNYEAVPIPDEDALATEIADGSGSSTVVNPQASGSTPATATAKPKDSYDDEEMAKMFRSPLFADEQFKYSPDGQKIPLESLGYLATGLMGVEAGNVETNLRDEQVSEGLRNYAANIAKIAKMGLSPEEEGKLKRDMSDMYQTSLTNITRASNGNRNLILGNQGQADAVRMKGLTDMALMDVDRRDKAMAQYGEIMKYMNDFDANRDIANNERKYREIEKKQMAGSALAQQGFSSFMDSIKNARENGPGSVNDQYKQALLFSISGVNANIPDDGTGTVPGTPSYAKVQSDINNSRKTEREKTESFYNSMNKEERSDFSKFLFKNPQFKIDENKDLKADAIINEYKNRSGQSEAKAEAQAEAGILPITLSPEEQKKSDDQKYDLQQSLGGSNNIISLTPEQIADDRNQVFESTMPQRGQTTSPYNFDAQEKNKIDAAKEAQDRLSKGISALEQYMPISKQKDTEFTSMIDQTEKSTNELIKTNY